MKDERSRFRPRTKAEWLQDQFAPDEPTFPLDPEIKVACPKDLPGKLPTNGKELYADEEEALWGRRIKRNATSWRASRRIAAGR